MKLESFVFPPLESSRQPQKMERMRPVVNVLLGESREPSDARQCYFKGATEFFPWLLTPELPLLISNTIVGLAQASQTRFKSTTEEIEQILAFFADAHFGSSRPERCSTTYRKAFDRLVYNVAALTVQRSNGDRAMLQCSTQLMLTLVKATQPFLFEVNDVCKPPTPLCAFVATLELADSGSVFETLDLAAANSRPFLLFADELFRLALDERDFKIEKQGGWTSYLWQVCSSGYVAVSRWCLRWPIFKNHTESFSNAEEFCRVFNRESENNPEPPTQTTPDRTIPDTLKRSSSSLSNSSPVAKRLCMC
jgi:hypothetical protein